MAENNIFIDRAVTCLACGKKSSLRYPNPKVYRVIERESDMRAVSYRWAVSGCEVIRPHYYTVYQCPSCMFATMAETFETPQRTFKEEYLIEAYKALPDDRKVVLFKINKLVPRGDMDLTGALALHLSAVFIAGLPKREKIDNAMLGRLALRLAWLYREKNNLDGSAEQEKGVLTELRVILGHLQRRIDELGNDLGEVKRAAAVRAEELDLPTNEGENLYVSITSSLDEKLEEMQTLVKSFGNVVLHDTSGEVEIIGEDAEPAGIREAFLLLGTLWPELPRDEEQALRLAVGAFEYSYNHETARQSVEQNMSFLSLLVDLLVRIGEPERALQTVAELYRSGMTHQRELRKRINEGKRSGEVTVNDERSINRTIGVVKKAISEAGETRRSLLGMMRKKYEPVINKVLEKTKGKRPAEREKALRDAEVPNELVEKLKFGKKL